MSDTTIPERKNPGDVLVTKEADVEASKETVFEVLEDVKLFEELEENVKNVEIVSEVKSGKGMKSQWLLENPGTGERWEVYEEFVEYDKPNRIYYIGTASDGNDYAGIHTLTENENGTTHHLFNEMFYFDADPEALGRVVEGMVQNVKQEAERRTKNERRAGKTARV